MHLHFISSVPFRISQSSVPVVSAHSIWHPKDFVYTDGSQVTGNPTLGASIVNPTTYTTTHIEIKSRSERPTIIRVELTVITLALEANRENPTLSILTYKCLENQNSPKIRNRPT